MKGSAIVAAIARHPRRYVALTLLLAGLALWPASRLRLTADLATMLPVGSPAADGYRVFLDRFGGLEKVFVLILADPAEDTGEADLIRAAGLLEQSLASSAEVASVRAGLDAEDEAFFFDYVAPRAALLISDPWLAAIRRRIEPAAIHQRVLLLRAALAAPVGSATAVLARSDPLGILEDSNVDMAPAGLPIDPLSSTFLAPDGTAALLVLTPARSEVDPVGGRALATDLEASFEHVRSQLEVAVQFQAVGGPLYAAQDEYLLREDLQRTLAGSLIGTSALLIAAFRGLLMPLAALAPLLVALLWSAGAMGMIRAELGAISIGFAAVLIGLGVDYGIHGVTRFRQSWLTGADAAVALADTWRHTGPGILTSALTTAAGFVVLGLAHFQPLQELGQLVALGIVSILAAVAILGSALLILLAPSWRRHGQGESQSQDQRQGQSEPQERAGWLWNFMGWIVERVSALGSAQPAVVLVSAAIVTGIAAWHLGGLSIDPDLRQMRPVDHPAHESHELLASRFGLGLDTATVVVQGDDLPQVLERAAQAGGVLRRALGDQVEISNPADVLVMGAPVAERLRQLADLPLARAADDLERELRAVNLNPRAFATGLDALRAMGQGRDPAPPPVEAWPDWLADSLTMTEDGAFAAISLRLPIGSWPEGPPAELLAELTSAVPGSMVASAPAIGAALRRLARSDLAALGGWALAAVAGVVLVSFRGRLQASVLASLPVVLGSIWTLGLWSGLNRPLDLFSLAVLPIMLGIGIDDGLHVLHGAFASETGSLGAVRAAGKALVLTTLTTCVGFGSLGLSRIPALQNGGLMIATGVMACLIATLLILPAIEAAGWRRDGH